MTCDRRHYTDQTIMEMQRMAAPDLTEYYRHVARQIATLPRSAHRHELGRLLLALRRAGVDVEILECALSEDSSG